METKFARFTGLKSLSEQGEFVATIAAFNHVDLDGDVTLPGAFPEGKRVQIAQWGHDWGSLPYGTAELRAADGEQQAHGKFNLDTSHGRDAYYTVKAAQDIQEWSYGFNIVEAEYGQFDGQEVRFLKRLDVAEISPVMRGAAGPGMTRVEDIKGLGFTMDEQADLALTAISAFLDRAKSLTDLRAEQGRKRISAANAARIARVHEALTAALPDLGELVALTRPADEDTDEEPKSAPIDLVSVAAEWDYQTTRLRELGILTA